MTEEICVFIFNCHHNIYNASIVHSFTSVFNIHKNSYLAIFRDNIAFITG